MSMWLANTSLMRPSIPDWLEDLCQRLTDNDPTLTTLEISHQRIDDTSVKYLSKALNENRTVTILIISLFNVVDDGSFTLGQVISANRHIKKLQFRDLHHSREVITLFEAVGRNDTIEEFSLRHCRICSRSAESLGILVRHQRSIKELRLVDSVILGDTLHPLAEGLVTNKTLERLFLVNCEIGAKEASFLGSRVAQSTTLKELHLSENNLGDDGVLKLCSGIQSNCSLTTLDLRSNNIGSKGALALETLIVRHRSLTHLYVGCNRLGCAGVASLATGLAQSSNILVLDLSDNGIEASGAEALARTLSFNPKLQDLNLSFNFLGDQGATAISSVLETNHILLRLGLRRNHISNVGATAIAQLLPSMRGLRELVLTKNLIDCDGAALLLAGLRTNMELEYLHIEDSDLSQPILTELAHWIGLNQAGRRIFRETNLDVGLWAQVLAKVNNEPNVLFHFLTEKPEFLQLNMNRGMYLVNDLIRF